MAIQIRSSYILQVDMVHVSFVFDTSYVTNSQLTVKFFTCHAGHIKHQQCVLSAYIFLYIKYLFIGHSQSGITGITAKVLVQRSQKASKQVKDFVDERTVVIGTKTEAQLGNHLTGHNILWVSPNISRTEASSGINITPVCTTES